MKEKISIFKENMLYRKDIAYKMIADSYKAVFNSCIISGFVIGYDTRNFVVYNKRDNVFGLVSFKNFDSDAGLGDYVCKYSRKYKRLDGCSNLKFEILCGGLIIANGINYIHFSIYDYLFNENTHDTNFFL